MKAVFKREFRSYFTSPIGYVFVAIMLFFEGFFFSVLYGMGDPNISYIFGTLPTVIAFILPVITMRMLSEDRKLKVDQALLTSPVSVTSIVLGKFFATLTVFIIPISVTLFFQIIVTSMVSVNWLIFLNAFFGFILLGAALISIGMFISSLTESSVISCILTLVIFMLIMLGSTFASVSNSSVVAAVVKYVALFDLYQNFTDGVFHTTDVVYLISITALFCFFSVRAVEKRRWA